MVDIFERVPTDEMRDLEGCENNINDKDFYKHLQ